MNSPQLALRIASAASALICLAHVLRLIAKLDITIGIYHVGLWQSVVALLVTGVLSVWFWNVSASATKLPERP